jgi:hypothetical protein
MFNGILVPSLEIAKHADHLGVAEIGRRKIEQGRTCHLLLPTASYRYQAAGSR